MHDKPELPAPLERWVIEDLAARIGLDPLIVAAVILQESSGNPYAIRHEPGYRWLYPPGGPVVAPKDCSRETEVMQQMTSWGPMQVMGAVARELGVMDPFLTVLCGTRGIEVGCRYLAKLKKRWPETTNYLAAFNAGRPGTERGTKYAAEVLARADTLKGVFE